MMQCFAITCLVTILWTLYGYGLAFGDGGALNAFRRVGQTCCCPTWTVDSVSGTIPETVFQMFQLTFAIITPALIVGAFAERLKFSAMLWFMGLWLTIVYAPVAHWCGAAAGWAHSASWTSRAARSSTSTPASPRWCCASCSAGAPAIPIRRWRRTAWS